MTTTGPLHPRRDDGTELDATFETSVTPVFDLVFHPKAGGRGSPRAIIQDYHEALEALLGRLARFEWIQRLGRFERLVALSATRANERASALDALFVFLACSTIGDG